MLDILKNNIFALMPVYRENLAELRQTLSSFQQMDAGLNIQLVIIVDGMQDSLPSLYKLLDLPASPHYQTCSSYTVVSGHLPACAHTKINFDLIVKNQHSGKRNSVALFLQLIKDSVEKNLQELKNKFPDATTQESLLNKAELSLFIVDSDTHFDPDALQYLYQTLWHESHGDVYCATPALQCRFSSYLDFFGLGQNAEYFIMNHFVLSYLVNGECIASDQLLFGLQACGMLKASYLMDQTVIDAYGKKASTFKEAITHDMNEDTFLSMLIRDKNPKLMYVPDAHASTALPAELGNFLIQKKRWRNGNLIQQKQLKQKKFQKASLIKKLFLRSKALLKKIFYSPATYFFLLMSVVNVAWSGYFHISQLAENLIFWGFLSAITAITLVFKISKFRRIYDVLAYFAAGISIFVYASLIFLALRIMHGQGSLLAWLALMAKGLTPIITILLIMLKKVERLPLFIGLVTKFILLDPIYNLIFPIYSVAKLDDLSWNISNIRDGEKNISQHFIRDGRQAKFTALGIFLIENISIGLLVSCLPVGFFLGCFALSEILQWFVLLLAPLMDEPAKHRPIIDLKQL